MQTVPLLLSHTATVLKSQSEIRRAAQLALSLGVSVEHIVATIQWAAVFGGELAPEPAFVGVHDLLDVPSPS